MHLLRQGVVLVAPLVLAGVVHQVVRAHDWLDWAHRSIDDVFFAKREVFGANKTLRGFLVVPLACAAGFAAEASLGASLPPELSVSPVALGLLLGIAAMLGELPNSLLKRLANIAPGARSSKRHERLVFCVLDHLDSAASCALALRLAGVPWRTVLAALALGPPLHVAVNYTAHAVHLRRTPW